MTKCLVIFSDDFRIKDNPALFYAALEHKEIIPVFIYNEHYLGRKIGAAAKVFLHYCLEKFLEILKEKYNAKLIIRAGNIFDEIKKIKEETNFDAIYFNKSYTKNQIDLEEKITKSFKNLSIKSFTAKILFEPQKIKNGAGLPYKVFTQFAKECLKNSNLIEDFLKEPKEIKSIKIDSLKISDLNLLPKNEGNWHLELIKNWEFNYQKIEKNIINFFENKLSDYSQNRNLLGVEGTSKISPYLRFGMISARIIFNAAQNYENHQQYILEILWREFAYHVMYYNQNLATKELKPEFANFAWEDNPEFFKKWQKGQTGFDVVDAAMKEIYATGTMHNRARMIVASFLIKDLLIDWRLGEQYFWDCLVDADVAINPFSWQWVFGSGYDAAPYFRVFNPDLQQEKFDEKGLYRKKWLQFRMNQERIVNHDLMRKIVLEKYHTISIFK